MESHFIFKKAKAPFMDQKLTSSFTMLWEEPGSVAQSSLTCPFLSVLSWNTPRQMELISRPIMLHRVIYGSIERFLGSLIEFYAGKFPLWLSSIQIYIVTVADRHADYAYEACKSSLNHKGFETYVDEAQRICFQKNTRSTTCPI